jgi:hypothetical protein
MHVWCTGPHTVRKQRFENDSEMALFPRQPEGQTVVCGKMEVANANPTDTANKLGSTRARLWVPQANCTASKDSVKAQGAKPISKWTEPQGTGRRRGQPRLPENNICSHGREEKAPLHGTKRAVTLSGLEGSATHVRVDGTGYGNCAGSVTIVGWHMREKG